MNGYQDRADLFRQAVLWLEEKGGEGAVMRVFGDPKPLEEIRGLDLTELTEVREALRLRMREALNTEKGVA